MILQPAAGEEGSAPWPPHQKSREPSADLGLAALYSEDLRYSAIEFFPPRAGRSMPCPKLMISRDVAFCNGLARSFCCLRVRSPRRPLPIACCCKSSTSKGRGDGRQISAVLSGRDSAHRIPREKSPRRSCAPRRWSGSRAATPSGYGPIPRTIHAGGCKWRSPANAWAWFARWLQSRGDGSPISEPALELGDWQSPELRVLKDGKLPGDAKSYAELIRQEAESLVARLPRAPTDASARNAWTAQRRHALWQVLGGEPKHRNPVATRCGEFEWKDHNVERLTLTTEDRLDVPALLIRPKKFAAPCPRSFGSTMMASNPCVGRNRPP